MDGDSLEKVKSMGDLKDKNKVTLFLKSERNFSFYL